MISDYAGANIGLALASKPTSSPVCPDYTLPNKCQVTVLLHSYRGELIHAGGPVGDVGEVVEVLDLGHDGLDVGRLVAEQSQGEGQQRRGVCDEVLPHGQI